jgi:hypothetical protein
MEFSVLPPSRFFPAYKNMEEQYFDTAVRLKSYIQRRLLFLIYNFAILMAFLPDPDMIFSI